MLSGISQRERNRFRMIPHVGYKETWWRNMPTSNKNEEQENWSVGDLPLGQGKGKFPAGESGWGSREKL